MLGTIASESGQRISRQTAAGYVTDGATVVSTAARTLATGTPQTAFGLFTISDAAAPLPVELSAFDVRRQNDDAALTWATASEKSNRGFEVQVSTNGTDFRLLAFVAGKQKGAP